MRFRLKATFLFLIITSFCLAQDWVQTLISGIGSIEFPSDPEIFDQSGVLIYKVENEDAFYLVSITQIDPSYNDEITANLEDYYEGHLEGVEEASGGTVTFKQDIGIDGVSAIDARISGVANPELPSLLFKRFVYVNSFNVSAEFRPKKTDELEFTALKDRFFNTLQLDVSALGPSMVLDGANAEKDAFRKGYEIGYVIGRIAFWVFLVIIAILIFYFIIKALKPKTKKEPKATVSKPITKQKIECTNCGKYNSTEAKYCSQCGYTLPRD
ncbi:zinc ribbon domain-containing protein [Winogradskyella vincentii]|uniref:Zinc ribbon domain-containing protein n=1 Tax=Winogradskyella vincentii TaxID=2877122 RepID=A0ABS7Y4X4_9FLAO|nr:zinc ribbon domain-containing protein [Winogradskyella vincentii]MCA0153677.1 zinc ribbon domain-containing protein [Winogradskyella vincentii]